MFRCFVGPGGFVARYLVVNSHLKEVNLVGKKRLEGVELVNFLKFGMVTLE